MLNFKTIDQAGSLKGKRVFLRIDLNVAIKDGRVADDFRLKKAFPTLSFIRDQGAKIILAGHLESAETKTVLPVFNYLKNYFPLKFAEEVVGDKVTQAVADMQDGDILLLENLRLNPGEKANDPDFAKQLAALADLYVDEAFSAAHREHASIVGIPQHIPGYGGFCFKEEVEKLSAVFHPATPFLFILGGAKFDTKLPLVTKFLTIADSIYIGGALANDCFKAKGYNVGDSVVSDQSVDLKPIISNPKIILPSDVVVQNGDTRTVKKPTEVVAGDKMWDEGPQSLADLKALIAQAKFILWNGPLGHYEFGFRESTLSLAKMIAESGAQSVVGGGDTLAAIAELNLESKFGFVSTAGGAMLDFLANETLPGIEALQS